MSDPRWQRLQQLFSEALELPAEAREEFVSVATTGDPTLRDELQRLLAADEAAGTFLAATSGPAPEADLGVVGPFRLLEVLGEGGFGVVYLAEQAEPIRRRVALKLVRPDVDRGVVIARFETERRAIARMDHPGIAQVFEAGTSDTGRPYFAMEYVDGRPITTYCDERLLDLRARLRLFADVCDAVQHAHQKGVIHRDLKPSNILVATRDDKPFAKIIDFGIAKATEEAIDRALTLTREGMIVGTLGYMSPEQAGGSRDLVDTRSDLYSLGVLLYELLTGALPFDADRLQGVALSDAVRVIREEEPPPPATRLLARGEITLEKAARCRGTDARRLRRALRGDLQWIALRALEKDPDHRYPSAAELAADVRRHLADEPVLAAAPTTLERLRKYARRHRGPVLAAGLVTLALAAGGVTTAVGFARAVRAERRARLEAETSQQVADFLVELFETASPEKSEEVSVREVLQQGTRRMEAGFRGDARVRARLLTTLGQSNLSLGLRDEGVRLLGEALTTVENMSSPEPALLAEQTRALAHGFLATGRTDSVDTMLDHALALAEEGRAPAGVRAACLLDRGSWFAKLGDTVAADSVYGEALAVLRTETPPDSVRLMYAQIARGINAARSFRLDDAERDCLSALELAKILERPARVIESHRLLAWIYNAKADIDRAVLHGEEGARLARKLYDPNNPSLASALTGLAQAHAARNDARSAEEVYGEVIRIYRERGVSDVLAHALNSSALIYLADGKEREAIANLEEAVSIRDRLYGRDNIRSVETRMNLGHALSRAGRYEEADGVFRQVVPVLEREDGSGGFLRWALSGWGVVCRDTGRLPRADSLFARAAALFDTTDVADQVMAGINLVEWADLKSRCHDDAIAETWIRTGQHLAFGDDPDRTFPCGRSLLIHAAIRVRAGDPAAAVRFLADAVPCGIRPEHLAEFPELAALRGRPDYPFESSP
ncbi:MAG: tetratricopeptide repeat protein [bacterium]